MPVKKSAFFSILLTLCSVCLLMFTTHKSNPSEKIPAMTVPVKCSRQCNGNKLPVQWNIVSGNIFQLEG